MEEKETNLKRYKEYKSIKSGDNFLEIMKKKKNLERGDS